MKIKQLLAEDVHGYLALRVDFHEQLTFLTGLNGSGKTSVLRLLVALLTPTPEEIVSISFSTATVSLVEKGVDVTVTARKTPDGLELSINTIAKPLVLTSSDLQLLIDFRRRDEHRGAVREDMASPVFEKILQHPVYRAIRDMATPMFLGLDRRFFGPTWTRDESPEARRREFMIRRLVTDDPSLRGAGTAAGLADVNYLVFERMQELRAAQEKLDEDLRRKFFTRAFQYKPGDISKGNRAPSRSELEKYRAHLTTIERAAEGLRLPVPELQAALSDFFERMTRVVDSLEESAKPKAKSRSKKASEKAARASPFPDKDFVEWIVNKPQSDRILEHLQLLDEYVSSRASLREPIDRFVNLINGFLTQTRKRVSVAGTGELQVHLDGNESARSITALSSGERQLLVMLGHLSLNTNLVGSGVFIVDEPELSLHIAWQERFVDAVTEANPTVQLILATHSPAIILDRLDSCRSLS